MLILIPVFALLYLLSRYVRRKKLERFGDTNLVNLLIPEVSKSKHIIKFVLVSLAFTFVTLAAANPQIGSKTEEIKREGVEVIIAIDISNSMKAEDLKPNRLERAKQAVLKLIDKLKNDRIGIVLFAGDTYLQLPLTMDYAAAKLLTSSIDVDLISQQGTAIGNAINLALDSYTEQSEKYKALIIITDGENHEDDALGAARDAASKGVVIHTIGMGSIAGAPVPIYSQGGLSGFIRDREGNSVISKLDPVMLQQIATEGGGKFIHATGTDLDLSELLDELAGMEKKEFASQIFTEYDDKFQYFLAIGLLLMISEIFFSERINKWLASLNLFSGEKNGK